MEAWCQRPLDAGWVPGEGSGATGLGSVLSKGLASVMAIVNFLGSNVELAACRGISGRALLVKLATVLNDYHLRDVTTWSVTADGAVEANPARLSDYAPGAFQKPPAAAGASLPRAALLAAGCW